MKEIKRLANKIRSELGDAKEYILDACNTKMYDKQLADSYYKLAKEELVHADVLHKEAVRKIEAYRKENGDPPSYMQEQWEEEHTNFIKCYAEIQYMISMYSA